MSNNKSSGDLTIFETLKTVFDSLLAESIHVSMPGVIESYDSKTRKATVLPQLKKKFLNGDIIPYKPIPEVPVVFYGVTDAGLRLPESKFKGTTVLLIFCERSLDFWLEKGTETEPGSTRKFDLTDAMAIVSLNSFNNTDAGGNNLELFYNDSVVRIRPDGIIEMGIDTFKKVITEDFQPIYNDHRHNFIAAPSGAFSTSKPVQTVGTIPVSSVGGAIATFDSIITSSEMTNKVELE